MNYVYSDSVGLGGARDSAFLTNNQVMLLLGGVHSEQASKPPFLCEVSGHVPVLCMDLFLTFLKMEVPSHQGDSWTPISFGIKLGRCWCLGPQISV